MKVTDAAAMKISNLEGYREAIGLRVYVRGGGCSGFSYGFQFDNEVSDDDLTFEDNEIKLIIDVNSYHYIKDSELDYVEKDMSSKFILNNPQVTATCGCGESFSA